MLTSYTFLCMNSTIMRTHGIYDIRLCCARTFGAPGPDSRRMGKRTRIAPLSFIGKAEVYSRLQYRLIMSHHVLRTTLQSLSAIGPAHARTDVASYGLWRGSNGVNNRVLIIQTEPPLSFDLLSQAYREHGYHVEVATASHSRERILQAASQSEITVVELRSDDAQMFALCEWLRERWRGPLLILTSAFAGADVVRVYQMGADGLHEYPWSMRVVMARTEALLRRSQGRLCSH